MDRIDKPQLFLTVILGICAVGCASKHLWTLAALTAAVAALGLAVLACGWWKSRNV